MRTDRLETFTDREEEVALFDLLLRGRDPEKPWLLLPILTFIAPGGSGKSTLIGRLIEQCRPDGLPTVPYARLDFTVPGTPTDLLSILMLLSEQLHLHADRYDEHLTFPRFDLGALIAQDTSKPDDLSKLGPHEVQRNLSTGKQFLLALGGLGSPLAIALGHPLTIIPAIMAGLTLVAQGEQIPALRDILSHLESSTGWQWYRRHGTTLGLSATASMKDVLLRLYVLSRPGKPEREWLVNDVLPAAFAADLYGALVEATPPQAWTQVANVVIFLDGFEALQRASSTTAMQLLQGLAIEPRKQGQTDPLLLVIGSRDPLPGMTEDKQPVAFPRTVEDEATAKQQVHDLYTRWQQRLPSKPQALRYLGLEDLVLPLWLQDFGHEQTRSYLLKVGEQEQTAVFEADDLVRAIHDATYGHPLFLALAAETVLKADALGRPLLPADFLRAKVSPEIAPGHQAEEIGKYLLDLFLRQLPEAERIELIRCAVPRVLDVGILRELLPSLDTINVPADERWQAMRRLSFLSAVDEQRSVLHPVVRGLLLRRLPASADPDKDFVRIHRQLKDYFTQRAASGEDEAGIEAAYHALALGEAKPAIDLGIRAQQGHLSLSLWEPLLEAVRQAPTDLLLHEDTEALAGEASEPAGGQHEIQGQGAATAVVLYTWLLSAAVHHHEKSARLQYSLGLAYSKLPGVDREANLRHAIAYFEAASHVYTREAVPVGWAMLQDELGIAYSSLPSRDREANLRQAIAYHEAALQVRTRAAFPVDWARTQHNLGLAYSKLPGVDREANLRHAIACYEAALQVYTRAAFPVDWARTQNNLGLAYSNLPGVDREANLRHAIACYEAALQVRTRAAFPVDWATTQNNLGIAYSNLPGVDREANLRQAIAYYEAALQVRTRAAFPVAWATTQNNLGIAYNDLPGVDREANLRHAIACYEAALQVRTLEAFPVDWAWTQNELGVTYSSLPGVDREANLRQAIACYEAALQICTREAFPVEWAATQNNLGIAYSNLPGGDREANLRQAIAYYEAALQVHTRAAFPADWARTQHNLGAAYSSLPGGEREANLRQAIACYEAALQVRTLEAFPVDCARTQHDLGVAYSNLPSGDREANLRKAIGCYEAALQIFSSAHMDNYSQMATGNLEWAKGELQKLTQPQQLPPNQQPQQPGQEIS